MTRFSWPIRVYYEDTDAGGVVYHASYLCFLERARTEMLRSFGIEQPQLKAEQGIVFAVRSISVDYLKPALFNDLLTVTTQISLVKKVSLNFEQTIQRDEVVLCTAQVQIACLDAVTLRPKLIPNNLSRISIID